MLRFIARDFLCGQANAKDQFDLPAIGMLIAREVFRKHEAIKVEARRRVRVSPTQAIRQAEVDDLLHFLIRGARVGRPVEGRNDLASVNADEVMPKLRAIILPIFRDDERAEGSVDVKRGVFFIFHTYNLSQIMKKARDFFTIKKLFFVLDIACWHGICVAYSVSA
jgi:hypothetical protein